MRLLLDTNVVLWMLDDPERLSLLARDAIDDASNTLMVSTVSILEVAIKLSTGKLEIAYDLLEAVAEEGCEILDVKAEHAWTVRSLPLIHRDPFDRLLVAQAICERVVMVTSDRTLPRYGAPILRA
ncbi:type II toxin-antitoxin system VapC family toxin [Brevundimonas sp.]|uniref:type II toxin-antitoxin system VapC family toxin n=1 Tax=Brevundimonas sp. TaxID=1871086 RepID=UPI001D2014FA|nr:type II toxin-antitoxin system VapC family toxin [Brevundimonas sp.]MBA3999639.1 PIN domain nuclease [Brevundimonas sp.]